VGAPTAARLLVAEVAVVEPPFGWGLTARVTAARRARRRVGYTAGRMDRRRRPDLHLVAAAALGVVAAVRYVVAAAGPPAAEVAATVVPPRVPLDVPAAWPVR
jgi:hypothetical protein